MLALLREGDSEPATLECGAQVGLRRLLDGGGGAGGACSSRRGRRWRSSARCSRGAREIEWTALKRAATPRLHDVRRDDRSSIARA